MSPKVSKVWNDGSEVGPMSEYQVSDYLMGLFSKHWADENDIQRASAIMAVQFQSAIGDPRLYAGNTL